MPCRTGRRPDATKVWNFLDNFVRERSRSLPGSPNPLIHSRCATPSDLRSCGAQRRGTSDGDTAGLPTDPVGGDWTTLPGNFKRNGYFVTGTGKTFHPGDPYQFDYPCKGNAFSIPSVGICSSLTGKGTLLFSFRLVVVR